MHHFGPSTKPLHITVLIKNTKPGLDSIQEQPIEGESSQNISSKKKEVESRIKRRHKKLQA